MKKEDVTLREISKRDVPFLRKVYASTREEELKMVDWPDEQKSAFLQMQFDAQHSQYLENYDNKEYSVIFFKGKKAGRLYLSRMKKEIRIVDIALITKFTGKGVGTYLLEGIMREGEETGKSVSIHVEKYNPALSLYKRLGFIITADREVYYFMEWNNPDAEPLKQ